MNSKINGKYGSNYSIKIKNYNNTDFSKICFVFPGQSSAYKEMFKKYLKIPIINHYFEIADKISKKNKIGIISNYIVNPNKISKNEEIIKNLALFTIEVSLGEYLIKEKNIIPKIITGHSFGEYAALVLSGICSFEKMFKFILFREKWCQKNSKNGKLIAIFENYEILKKKLKLNKDLFEISNINTPHQTVIGVKIFNLNKIEKILKNENLKFVILNNVNQPFHSRYMKELKNELKKYLEKNKIKFNNPFIPIYSSVLKREINSDNFNQNQIRKILTSQVILNVDFISQISDIFNNKNNKVYSFLEIGPKQITSKFIEEILKNKKFKILKLNNFISVNEIKNEKNNSKFFNIVQTIISKITGYQIDSIKIEDKFEEDLGIDSIKKADIVFKIIDEVKIPNSENLRLSEINSVKNLTDYLDKNIQINQKKGGKNQILIGKEFKRYKDTWIKKEILNIVKYNSNSNNKNYYLKIANILKNEELEFKKIVKSYNLNKKQNLIFINEIGEFSYNEIKILNIQKIILFIQKILNEIKLKNIILINYSENIYSNFEAMFKSIKTEDQSLFFKNINFRKKPNKLKLKKIINDELKEILEIDILYDEKFNRNVKYMEEIKYGKFKNKSNNLVLNDETIIVVLGGAKGITFEAVKEISSKYKCKIYLIGRSKLETVKNNINQLQKTNKNIFYEICDAQNYNNLNKIFKEIIKKDNKIDVLINGVGIHYDKRFLNKNLNEIKDELNIKLNPVINSFKLKDKYNIKKLIQYSSIVAKFPSHGQSIYSLSNKIINFLSNENKNSVSISWPAWYNVGMTESKIVLQSLIENNSIFIKPKQANKLLIEEIINNNSNKGKYVYYLDEILINKNKNKLLKNDSLKYSNFNQFSQILGNLEVKRNQIRFIKEFDINKDRFLQEHLIQKKPYISASTMLGMFLSVNYYINKKLISIVNFEIFNPIIIENSTEISIDLSLTPKIKSQNKIYCSCKFSNEKINKKKVKIGKIIKNYTLNKKLNSENLYVGEILKPIKKFYIDDLNQNIGILKNIKSKNFISNQFIDKFILIFESVFHTIGKETERTLPIGIKKINFKENIDISNKIYIIGKIVKEDAKYIYGDCYVLNENKEIIVELIEVKKQKLKWLN